MKNNIYIAMFVLFLFATVSAFVVNIRGDMQLVQRDSSVSVFPSVVPRYCDIIVTTSPSTLVKVYRQNGVDSGISCTTNSDGTCKFRFDSTQSMGTYYVKNTVNNMQAMVELRPGISCESNVQTLVLDPSSFTVAAGYPYIVRALAYDSNGNYINPSPSFSLTDTTMGNLSQAGLSPDQVMFVGKRTGTVRIRADYGGKTAYSDVTIVPGYCNDINVTSIVNAWYTVGSTIVIDAKTTDTYGNDKGDVQVTLKYYMPDGTVSTLTNTSNASGDVQFVEEIGIKAGNGRIELLPYKPILCAQNKAEYNFEVKPGNPYMVEVIPQYTVKSVGQTQQYVANVYDKYSNRISNPNIRWSSSNPVVATIDQQTGIATAMFPGQSTITAEAYYPIVRNALICEFPGMCRVGPKLDWYSVNGTAQMTVSNGAANDIVLSPMNADVPAGDTLQFSAVVYDVHGAQIQNPSLTWSTDVGTITGNGLFTAQSKVGSGVVNVSYNGITKSATVNVIPNAPARIDAVATEQVVPVNSITQLYANVTDRYDNPVEGVQVDFEILSGDATIDRFDPTDANGIAPLYVLTGNSEGTVIVKMTVSGTSISDTTSFMVVVPNATITGTVLDSMNNPVDNAVVLVENTPYQNTTDANGRYVIYDVSLDGVYNITASKNGYTSMTVEHEIHKNTVYAIDFSLIKYAHVSGSVTDSSGNPIQNANVSIIRNGVQVASMLTQANGGYMLEIAPVPNYGYTVQAVATGYQPKSVDTVIMPGDSLVLNFNMGDQDNDPPLIYFVGQTPAADSYVKGIVVIETLASDPNYDSTEIIVNGQQVAVCSTITCSASVNTAQLQDGQVLVEAVARDKGGLTSTVSRNLFIDNIPPIVEFIPPTPANGSEQSSPFVVNVSADDATGINKIVISINGNNAVECNGNVCSYTIDPTLYSGVITVVGTAYSELNSNSTQRQFNITQQGQQAATLLVSANPSNVLTGENSIITATLLDTNGRPIQGQQVRFTSSGGVLNPTSNTTDSNGHATVSFSSQNAGTFTVNAVAGQLTNSTQVTVSAPAQSGALAGTITNASGVPLSGAVVELYKNNQKLFETTTNQNGQYSINVPADRYDIVVSYSGYLSAREYGVVVSAGQTTTKDYVLTKLSRLYGTVSNETGSPVAGATLKAYRNGQLIATVQSQADGSYEFIIASGVYVVETTHPDYYRALYTIYVPPVSEVQKNVVLYR
ncbi:MAG: carboxypeptidase regulatory-like domain-containing protein [Candidatus Micrarchaeia archaeon]